LAADKTVSGRVSNASNSEIKLELEEGWILMQAEQLTFFERSSETGWLRTILIEAVLSGGILAHGFDFSIHFLPARRMTPSNKTAMKEASE
jgi:hypothetical protein